MERQVRAATLDNFAAARFIVVIKKGRRKKSCIGDKEEKKH